jgi:TetR/AcrR family transcriptional regulator
MARTRRTTSPKQRILEVAAKVFAASGFAGARVDDIAERAGVNKAMLYYHVGNKQALYAAVLLDTIDHALARLDGALGSAESAEDRLRLIIATVAAAAREKPNFGPLMLRELASGGTSIPDSVIRRMARLFRTVAETLADGQRRRHFRNVDPVMTHMCIMSSVLVLTAGAPIRRRIRDVVGGSKASFVDCSAADIAKHVSDLVLEGLQKRPSVPAGRRGSAK